ncbi:MAG: LEA type 2 family protein [Woeseiaceae bacterium]|nr:LEA type 2 family protein [Woeseiaceae bacterium]
MVTRMKIGSTLVAALLLTACASHRPTLQSPAVELSGVELEELSFDRQSFLLHFDASNPNGIPLPVRSLRYKVFLERQEFASGETTGHFTIPANGNKRFSVDVELDLMSSASRLVSLLGSSGGRPLEYDLHGSLAVAVPFARPLNFSAAAPSGCARQPGLFMNGTASRAEVCPGEGFSGPCETGCRARRGLTPLSRTLTKRPIMAREERHGKKKKILRGV